MSLRAALELATIALLFAALFGWHRTQRELDRVADRLEALLLERQEDELAARRAARRQESGSTDA